MPQLIHSACGGAVAVDRSSKVEVLKVEGNTEILYPIRCSRCGEHLGMLPDVETNPQREDRRPWWQ